MEGLTSPAKELSTGSGSTIHPTAWKKNSTKFAVAIFTPLRPIQETTVAF
jgi:hypothetical protein